MSPSARNRTPSAIDALGQAVSHMREKLFPFNFVGWITLGFVALLESCGSGSGTGGVERRIGSAGTFEDPTRALESVFGWIAAHMLIFVSILMAVMVLSLVLMWLRSRTIFVYIDDVATGRFDLVRPWNQHGAHADSFFVLSLIIQGASLILLVLVLGLGGFFVLWAKAHDWATLAVLLGVLPIAFIFGLALLAAAVLNMALRDFVAPLQVSLNVGAREAGSAFLFMLGANPGLLVGYALLKFLVGMVVGLAVVLMSCLTCCIGALPLVNQTLFQPIYYAERAWSLKLLAQMGEDVFAKLTPHPDPKPSRWQEDLPTDPIDRALADTERIE